MGVVKIAESLSLTTVYDRVFSRAKVKKFAFIAAVVAISGAALAVRIVVPEHSPNDDAVEYVNIARHLAARDGYVISLKWHCYNSKPVVRPAWGERLPGNPFMLATGLALGGDIGMKAGFAAVSVALIILFIYCVSKDFSPRVALWASILLVFSPNLIANAADYMSEVLFLPLILAGVFFVGREKKPLEALITGGIFGVAMLTRYEAGALFLVSFFLRPRHTRLAGVFYSCIGFAAVIGPYSYINYTHNGSPLYTLHFGKTWGADAAAYSRSLAALKAPTTLAFVPEHLPAIATNVLRNFYNYVKELTGYKFLSLLSPFVLFAAPSRRQARYLVVAALVFVFYGFSWSAMNLQRFMLLPYLFLLPFALVGFENVLAKFFGKKRRFATAAKIVVFGTVVFLYGAAYYANVYHREDNPVYAVPGYAAAVEFLEGKVNAGEGVMARDAWELNWKTGIPAAVLPIDADYDEAAAWGREIGVRYILAGRDEVPTEQMPAATFGYWRIFDLSARVR